MKIEKILCDRCGREVVYPTTRKIFLSKIGREGGLDLCDNCHKQLYNWLNNEIEIDFIDDICEYMTNKANQKEKSNRKGLCEHETIGFVHGVRWCVMLIKNMIKIRNTKQEGD